MKGFVKTLEASIGTLVLLGMIFAFAATDFSDPGEPADLETVNQQLNTQSDLVENSVREKNVSKLKQGLDTSILEKDASIHIEESYYSSTTDSSTEDSFEFDENSTSVDLYLWNNDEEVSVVLNDQTVYSSETSFERVSLQPEEGVNELEFGNPSEERLSYLVNVEKRFGDSIPDAEEIYVARKTVGLDSGTDAEVNIYLWR